MRESLEGSDALTRLTRLSAIGSMHRNLAYEDEAARKNIAYHEAIARGEEPPVDDGSLPEDDGMQILAARDVYINSPPNKGAIQQTPNKTPTTLPVALPLPTPTQVPQAVPTASAGVPGGVAGVAKPSLLKQAALVAAILSAGATPASLITYLATRPQAVAPYNPADYQLRLLPPDKEPEDAADTPDASPTGGSVA